MRLPMNTIGFVVLCYKCDCKITVQIHGVIISVLFPPLVRMFILHIKCDLLKDLKI